MFITFKTSEDADPIAQFQSHSAPEVGQTVKVTPLHGPTKRVQVKEVIPHYYGRNDEHSIDVIVEELA